MTSPQRIPNINITKVPSSTKVAVITALWNTDLTENMENECLKELNKHKIKVKSFKVAGSFELIAAAKTALAKKYDAVIVLGVVLNGETPHFDYVCQAVTNGMTQLAVEFGKPIGFGVLTCNDYQQAYQRSGFKDSKENKGKETAEAVLLSLLTHKQLAK
ncbi:MAG: hypothetical protein RLZZ575_1075 [Actinomycetota bacterium]|jgi:6,7-dimethyl-8-ribityllumazine synthase